MNSLQEPVNGCSTMDENFRNSPNMGLTMADQTDEYPPDIEIIFKDEECEREFRQSIESCLKDDLKYGGTVKFSVRAPEHDPNEVKLFCIDNASSPIIPPSEPSRTISYTSPFSSPVVCEGSVEKQTTKKGKKSLLTCFNCLGDHHLKDCSMEHDGYRIANNRKEFMEQNTPTRRYHDDLEGGSSLSSKYNQVPGVISNELHRALGLKHNQLPMYIYNMRVLGYPPGWLAEAEVETSGITLFHSEDEAEDKKCQQQEKQYDFNKFIKYPGFNCPLPSGVHDDYQRLGMPPMQPHQMLSAAVKHNSVTTTATDVYKKKKQSFPERESKKQKSDSSEGESSTESLTNKTKSIVGNDKSNEVDATPESINTTNGNIVKNTKSLKEKLKDVQDDKGSPSVLVKLGVPIIETPNAYKKLPRYENFSQGISEHENFENLPDAVGTYDQMRGILDSVRQKLFQKP